MSGFDLDAVIGEIHTKPLKYQGKEFQLPGELPGAVVAPFLDDDLGLIDLVTQALAEADDKADVTDVLFEVLKRQPSLPKGLLNAANDALKALLGEDYDDFQALRPSVTAYLLIAKGVVTEYGVGLADFFASDEPSESDGETSKETSNSTTESTPEASGDSQEQKERSE